MMRVECSWCGRDMGEKFGPENGVSHGICGQCQEKVAAEIHARTEDCPIHGRHFPVRSSFAPGMVCPQCEAELLDDSDDGDGRDPVKEAERAEYIKDAGLDGSPTLAEVNARRGFGI